MSDLKEAMGKFVKELFKSVVTFLVDGLILKWGWNLLLLNLFPSLHPITYNQSLILIILAGILFKQKIVQTIAYKF